jgi:hypothetical protein
MHLCPETENCGRFRNVLFVAPDPRMKFQGCTGVPDPAGVFAPGVVESAPAFFFFFFFRGIRAGGFVTALRSDR